MEVIVKIKLLPVMASVVVAAAICMQGCTKGGKTATSGELEKTFVIGELWSETGQYASLGGSMYYGSELAVEEINSNGGVNIGNDDYTLELVGVDDGSDADMAKNAYNTLVDKGAQALIGPIWDEGCISVEKSANDNNMLMIMPNSCSSEIGKYDCSFRLNMSDVKQGREIADYAFYQMNSKNAAILYTENYKEIVEAFTKEFSDKGGNIIAREMYSDDTGVTTSVINSIRASRPDIVFVPAQAERAEKILKQIDNSGMSVSVVGDTGWYGMPENKYDSIKRAAYLSPLGDKSKKFADDYREKYGQTMDIYAAYGYDAVYTIKEALEEAGNVDSDLQICAMDVINFDGVTGNGISFDEYGNSTRDMEFVMLQ